MENIDTQKLSSLKFVSKTVVAPRTTHKKTVTFLTPFVEETFFKFPLFISKSFISFQTTKDT